jgi:uncharacterized membrane protein YphA (DoxX/SURF4 family)
VEVAVLVVRYLLALVFVVAALTKLADRPGTRRAIVGFGAPDSVADPLALALPAIELAAAMLLVHGPLAWWGSLLGLLLLLGFSGAIALNLFRGNAPDCHCFGQLYSEPISGWTLVRNGVLAAASGFVTLQGRVNQDPSAFRELGHVSATQWMLFAVAALLVVDLGTRAQPLLRGRMPASTASDTPQPTPTADLAPDFALPDVRGDTVTLTSLRSLERPLLLVFTDPHCGDCSTLLPELARLRDEYGERAEAIVISSGSVLDPRQFAPC